MGWRSWQLTHQPSCSSLNTDGGLLVQRLDLKDEKSWSLSRTKARDGGGTVRVGCDVGGLAGRRVGEGSGLWERASTEREGWAMLLQWQLGSVGGVERDHRGGAAGTAVRSLSAPDLQVLTTQHSGRRWEALGLQPVPDQGFLAPWTLGPGPWAPAATPAFSPVPSHSSKGPFTPLHQKNNSSICSHYLIFNCKSLKASHPLLLLI